MSSPIRQHAGIGGGVLTVFVAVAAAAAQIRPPTDKKFDVVSVKPDSAGDIPGRCGFSTATFSSPVQFRVDHCSLAALINQAYAGRITGVPKWAESTWYSVSATPASPASLPEKYAMLQAVLEDRFKLKWHRETQQLPVYYLSLDGALKLPKTVAGSCRAWDPQAGPPPNDPNQPPLCNMWKLGVLADGGRTMEAQGVTLPQLAGNVGRLLGRPGLDNTGSTELFDVHLEYAAPELGSADASAGGSAPPGSGGKKAPMAGSEPSVLPSIFTALKKVGLTVKSGQGPVEVFVVDSVQRPTEN